MSGQLDDHLHLSAVLLNVDSGSRWPVTHDLFDGSLVTPSRLSGDRSCEILALSKEHHQAEHPGQQNQGCSRPEARECQFERHHPATASPGGAGGRDAPASLHRGWHQAPMRLLMIATSASTKTFIRFWNHSC